MSAMPLLTSATGFSKTRGSITAGDETDEDRSGAPSPSGKKIEEAEDPSLATPTATDYPDDALFPNKRSAANLFLGDCLGVKNKEESDQINHL